MANPKILEKKQLIIDEIANNVKESSSFIFLDNTGLTVAETMELRRKLKESNSELKIYKNTLVARALESLNIDLRTYSHGENANEEQINFMELFNSDENGFLLSVYYKFQLAYIQVDE